MEHTTELRNQTQRVLPHRPPPRDLTHISTPQREVHMLAESLRLEYAGAVPPGQVIAVVCRAYRTAIRAGVAAHRRLEFCETATRRQLTDLIAVGLGTQATVLAR